MNFMKGFGRYKSPGLVQLRLGLKDEDGLRGKIPEPGIFGYHDTPEYYLAASKRFLQTDQGQTVSAPQKSEPESSSRNEISASNS
jgi:hypothetical protein